MTWTSHDLHRADGPVEAATPLRPSYVRSDPLLADHLDGAFWRGLALGCALGACIWALLILTCLTIF